MKVSLPFTVYGLLLKKDMRRSETIKRMMRFMKPVRLIGLLGLVSLMGGCSSDDVEETPGQQTLTLMPISSSFLEVEPIGGTVQKSRARSTN